MQIRSQVFFPNLIIFVLIVIFLLISLRKSRLQKRSIRIFIFNLIFGLVYCLFVIIYGLNIFQTNIENLIIKNIYLTFSGLQVIFFFLFIEDIVHFQKYLMMNLILWTLFIIQNLGYWLYLIFYDICQTNINMHNGFLLMGRIGYNFLAIFVYGFVCFPSYLKMYRSTRETRCLLLVFSLFIMFLGYVMTAFADITRIYNPNVPVYLQLIKDVGDMSPIVGILIFIIVYSTNIGYIYRIPFDKYLLLVSHKKSGLTLTQMEFQTKNHQINIKGNTFSSLITAIKHVYSIEFHSNSGIRQIDCNGVSILIENGEYISVLLVADKISHILSKGLKKFVKEYEEKFVNELKSPNCIFPEINEGNKIFLDIFPFLKEKIESNIRKEEDRKIKKK